MNCWICKEELIWGCDHDIDPEPEDFQIVTHLSCPNCNAYVEVYHPKEEEV
tara:strand:- start:1055 stop:1207 length:153 start_codon:yes stop_codon:yes gene_type:complete